MQSKLSSIKNIIWAMGIVLCLLALLVGLIFAAAVKYGGDQQDGTLYLGGEAPAKASASAIAQADSAGVSASALTGSGSLNSLAETGDGGMSYVDSLTFLCDSALVGLRDYGLLSGGVATAQVWGSSAGNIPASSIAQCTIIYPADGSEMSASAAAEAAKPSILIISLGMDGLGDVDGATYTAALTELLNNIHSASPDTALVCCSLTSVTGSYSGPDGITLDMVMQANEWIQQVCTDTGVYYADIASVLCDSTGALGSDYASANGKALNSAGINKVLEYLRVHALS